jgi:hypothetical protein
MTGTAFLQRYSRNWREGCYQQQSLGRLWQTDEAANYGRTQARFSFLIPIGALSIGFLRVARNPPGAVGRMRQSTIWRQPVKVEDSNAVRGSVHANKSRPAIANPA